MFSGVTRDDAYKTRLVGFVRDEYGIRGDVVSPAARGFFGETWRLDAGSTGYFVKVVDHAASQRAAYERSFAVLDRLESRGIDFVPHVVGAADGRLFTRFDGAVVGVFDWIDAVNTESDDTKIPEYAMMARVFTADVTGLDIPREDFAGAAADRVFGHWRRLAAAEGDAKASHACAVLEHHRAEIEPWAQRLHDFAARCAPDRSGFFLTHGDAGGNFMTAADGRYYIVDWDDPLLAPPERDAWVMCPREWARAAFTDALRREGIDYELRPERLAYYIYHMFFLYLSELLEALSVDGPQRPLEEFFDGFIRERLEYADTHFSPGWTLSS